MLFSSVFTRKHTVRCIIESVRSIHSIRYYTYKNICTTVVRTIHVYRQSYYRSVLYKNDRSTEMNIQTCPVFLYSFFIFILFAAYLCEILRFSLVYGVTVVSLEINRFRVRCIHSIDHTNLQKTIFFVSFIFA